LAKLFSTLSINLFLTSLNLNPLGYSFLNFSTFFSNSLLSFGVKSEFSLASFFLTSSISNANLTTLSKTALTTLH
jgi:hypothetical protein